MWEALKRWPLLLAAVICLALAVKMSADADDTAAPRAVLLALGSMLLGAWLYSLGHGPGDDGGGD